MHPTLYSPTWAENSKDHFPVDEPLQPHKIGWGGRIIRPCGPHPFGAAPSGVILPLLTSLSRTIFRSTNRSHRANMAGVEGFEPPYGGIKTRCLTAWRHPNLESTIGETSGAETQAAANLLSKGESFS